MNFKNISWNILGLGLPLITAFVTIPFILEKIGQEKFGILALSWGLIGYAGVLDFGIGRAATQLISSKIKTDDESQISRILFNASRITFFSGFLGMIILISLSLFGVYKLIHYETISNIEMLLSSIMVSIALPFQAMSSTYKGVNEAFLNFKQINLLKILLGIATFAGPFFLANYTTELHWLISTIVFSRVLAFIFYKKFSENFISHLNKNYSKDIIKNLIEFGGWFSVSNLISPILTQADRFIIGALISASAVTIYYLPHTITTKLLIISGSITTVIFPVISNKIQFKKNDALAEFNRWLKRILIYTSIPVIGVGLFIDVILDFWMGPQNISVTEESIIVGRILLIGVFFNTLGSMYFAIIHASGNSKVTAIIHIFEVIVFIPLLYILVNNYGIIGAATSWTIRMLIDSMLLRTYYKKYIV